jgi:hypothetical protein
MFITPATIAGEGTEVNARSVLSVLVEGSDRFDEFLLFFGDVFDGVNRIGSAGRNAGAAVNTALGIDVHLGGGFECGLVQLGMDAVGGADVDA